MDSLPLAFVRGLLAHQLLLGSRLRQDTGRIRIVRGGLRRVDVGLRPAAIPGDRDFPGGHPDLDGSGRLFELLTDPAPEAFQAFAEDCYEIAVDLEAVRHVHRLRPLDRSLIAGLNPTTSVSDVVREALSIGYPVDPALPPGPS